MQQKKKPTTVKLLVGHDNPSAAFNSLEFAWKADQFDGEVCVRTIQANTVVTAGYLFGSRKTMDDIHWSDHYNNYPRLLNMDLQVKTQNVPDPSRKPWSPKNQVSAAHIFCSEINENDVNIQMGGMYNNKRKESRAAADLPEIKPFCYVPFQSTHKISQTPVRNAQLQKNRPMYQWMLQQHHSIPFWDLVNIYKVCIASNGH